MPREVPRDILSELLCIYTHQDPLIIKHLWGLVFNCVVMNMIKLQHLTLNTFYIEIVWEVKIQGQKHAGENYSIIILLLAYNNFIL